MKPAFSVLIFTVSSGAGLGMLILLAMARLAHSSAPSMAWWTAMAVAMLLVSVGLISSTQHLAKPRNAWRAFSRFATSWLSREGVFAVLLYPAVAAYAAAVYFQSGAIGTALAITVIALSLLVLICTGMIYACLKTIPRWRSWQTVVQYPLFGLMTGALILMAMIPDSAAVVVRWIAVFCLIVGAVVKFLHHRRFREPSSITIGQALQTRQGRPRLLDVGHSHPNFLTREFGFALSPERAAHLRGAMVLLAFVVPLILTLFAPALTLIAAVSCLLGMLVERYLFFAEARHVVNLYHGAQRI